MPHSAPGDAPFGLRHVVVIGSGLVAAVLAGVLIPQNPYLAIALLGLVGYGLTLTVNYRWLAVMIIAFQPAALIIPYLPGRPFLWEVCALVAWPSLVGAVLVNRRRLEHWKLDTVEICALVALTVYLVVLFSLMAGRGVGFRVFGGGSQMGGRFYVQQIILAIVPLLFVVAAPTPRTVVAAAAAGWVLSITYLISDFALAVGGPRFYPLLQFFELPTDAVNFFLNSDSTGVRRYQSLWFVGASLVAAVCATMPLRDVVGRRIWWGLPLLLAGIYLGLLSGHRTALMHTVFTLALLTLFQRFWTPLRLIGGALGLSAALAVLYVSAPQLPLSVQRSISVLPFIEVSPEASADAFATARDRLEIFRLGFRDLPDYWLLGRGFGLERGATISTGADADGIAAQYENGLFHNGLMGTLVKTGLPGLLATLVFFAAVSKLAYDCVLWVRQKGSPETWSTFDRLALLLSAQWFSLIIFFFLIHGDAGVWAHTFMLPAGLVMLCRRNLRGETGKPAIL